jgi:hypothetical protein
MKYCVTLRTGASRCSAGSPDVSTTWTRIRRGSSRPSITPVRTSRVWLSSAPLVGRKQQGAEQRDPSTVRQRLQHRVSGGDIWCR